LNQLDAECRIREFHPNNMLSHTRFVPYSISNKITLPANTETHANTTNIDLLYFLEILKWARWGRIWQLFLYWFTQSQSYIQFTRTTWAWFSLNWL